MNEELHGDEIFTLTDEEGNENKFELLGSRDLDGKTYLALVPQENNEEGDYVILRLEVDENGEEILVTIDDDAEFDRIADVFDNELFDEIDYDASSEEDKKE